MHSIAEIEYVHTSSLRWWASRDMKRFCLTDGKEKLTMQNHTYVQIPPHHVIMVCLGSKCEEYDVRGSYNSFNSSYSHLLHHFTISSPLLLYR
jgi:hypothetical protein